MMKERSWSLIVLWNLIDIPLVLMHFQGNILYFSLLLPAYGPLRW
jgi:hypothetical protein